MVSSRQVAQTVGLIVVTVKPGRAVTTVIGQVRQNTKMQSATVGTTDDPAKFLITFEKYVSSDLVELAAWIRQLDAVANATTTAKQGRVSPETAAALKKSAKTGLSAFISALSALLGMDAVGGGGIDLSKLTLNGVISAVISALFAIGRYLAKD